MVKHEVLCLQRNRTGQNHTLYVLSIESQVLISDSYFFELDELNEILSEMCDINAVT